MKKISDDELEKLSRGTKLGVGLQVSLIILYLFFFVVGVISFIGWFI